MAVPVQVTKTLAAADTNIICETQTPLAGGNLVLDGDSVVGAPPVAVLDTARRVLFTFGSDETGRTFVVYGTSDGSSLVSESVAGAAATAVTTMDFKTVSRITIDAASAGTIIVGTNGVGATQWYGVNYNVVPTNLSIGVVVTGTVNYTVQYTYDNFWTPDSSGYAPSVNAFNDPIVAAVTSSADTTFNNPITGWRVQINSGTGSLAIRGIQSGIING